LADGEEVVSDTSASVQRRRSVQSGRLAAVPRFAFLAGLPRSGSTLLASLLNQRPDVYVSTNSPVAQLMWETEQMVPRLEQYRANPNPAAAFGLVAGILPTYYADRTEAVVIDKCRAWGTPGNLRMLTTYVTEDVRIVCLTRPVIEVLASFIRLMHENPPGSIFDRRLPEGYRPLDDRRCDALMMPGGEMDRSLWSVHNLRQPEHARNALLLTYAELVDDARDALRRVETFLGLEPFDYETGNVRNAEPENDSVYGLAGMHEVRPTIERRSVSPEEILSDYVLSKYGSY
jgi:sulfotransferase